MSQSALKYRPRTFKEVIGQKKVLNRLTNLWETNDWPNAFLFHGPSGIGKTTVASIVALSVQCEHSKKMGKPCKVCRRKRKSFPIFPLNASDATGIDEIRSFVKGSGFGVLTGKYKVYILDEAHMLSSSAQNLLLKYFEPEENGTEVLWFICTTKPEKIVNTLRQRCRLCKFTAFSLDEVKLLVERMLKKKESDLDPEPLVDELYENRITSGRLICNAVDNYCAGEQPEEAVAVELESEVNITKLSKSVRTGDWNGTQVLLKSYSTSQVRLLKAALIGYFQEVLLNGSDVSKRTEGVVKALSKLTQPAASDDHSQYAAFAATLYELCRIFANHSV